MRVWLACILPIGAIGIAAGTAIAFAPHAETASLELRPAYDPARIELEYQGIEETTLGASSALGPGWIVQANDRTGTLQVAYGGWANLASGIGSETAAAFEALGFLIDHAAATGVRATNSELRSVRRNRNRYVARYGQVVDDLPVLGVTAFVLVYENGRVAAFGSDFVPHEARDAAPSLTEGEAIDRAAAAIGAQPRADRPATAELVYQPVPLSTGAGLALELAYRVVFEAIEPFGKWESVVQADTGEILARTNDYHFVDVTGNVNGDVEDFSPCDGTITAPLELLTVNVDGGNSDDTDANGDFVISHAGMASVTVTANLSGPFLAVDLLGGTDANFSGTTTPGTPLQITWDASNARRDERDVFFHGVRSHQFMKAIDPGFVGLDYSMPATVANLFGICPGNAWWDGFGINFCSGGEGYRNTGRLGNVIYHEYGHGVTQEWYNANGGVISGGDMHEGNADVLANFLERNSIIGLGFFQGDCANGIRNSDNNLQWPEDNNGGHFGGQIIAGFHWDSWQSLLGAMPQAQADSIAWHTWHFGRGLGTPRNQPEQVLWTFLADDDDGDMLNGTPNYDHFCLGAQNHGFPCPPTLDDVDAPVIVAVGAGAFRLEQNQPNPAAAATRIEYSIPDAADVDLAVYNVRGQVVRRLTSGSQQAGTYRVTWDGRDVSGVRVAGGVYFYRLVAGEKTLTKKMTVVQ